MDANWYEHFFSGLALEFWRRAVPPEQTQMEAAFALEMFPPGARLLDVPCGNGRLARALAERGFDVTGVDVAPEFIEEARQKGPPGEGGDLTWLEGDMISIGLPGGFDGALCFGNSFGYFARHDTQAFLRNVASALKPGGLFILQSSILAESLLPEFQEKDWYEMGDLLATLEHEYLPEASAFETVFTFYKDGQKEERVSMHYVFTLAETLFMLKEAGLAKEAVYADLEGMAYFRGAPQAYILTRKKSD